MKTLKKMSSLPFSQQWLSALFASVLSSKVSSMRFTTWMTYAEESLLTKDCHLTHRLKEWAQMKKCKKCFKKRKNRSISLRGTHSTPIGRRKDSCLWDTPRCTRQELGSVRSTRSGYLSSPTLIILTNSCRVQHLSIILQVLTAANFSQLRLVT